MLDSSHSTIIALRRLVDAAHVAGGSFAASLPLPAEISPADRVPRFESAKQTAVQECISELLRAAGLPRDMQIGNRPEGDRKWPGAFVGSLTNKGTVVLGTLCLRSFYSAIGIDLEIIDDRHQKLDQHAVAPEGILAGVAPDVGTLVSFSAKEAVFKAQFPQTRRRLDFIDIVLSWRSAKAAHFQGTAQISGGQNLEVRCEIVSPWILCAAFSLPDQFLDV